MNLITKLENEALMFANKQKRVEISVIEEMLTLLEITERQVKNVFKSINKVNIFTIEALVQNTISMFIDKLNYEMGLILDDTINNQYEKGIETSEKFIKLANETKEPLNKEEVSNKEALLALLLFGKNIVNGFTKDLTTDIERNLMNIYIASKNKDTELNNIFNTELDGEYINGYISPTFNKYKNRARVIGTTETNRALNVGMLLTYMAFKKQTPGLKVKWVEIRDQRLCKDCKAMAEGGTFGNGVYDIGEIQPPPLHANCRCVLIPFLFRWQDINY